MPALPESLALGLALGFVLRWLRPEWFWGAVFGVLAVLGTRALFLGIARRHPELLGLASLGKQVALGGLAVGGILLGFHPAGVVAGIAVWPVGLWLWAVRHVRDGR